VIVVPPEYVLFPERLSVPLPFWVSTPVPEITEAKSVPWVTVLLRLKISVPLFVMELLEERLPAAPPLPIWSVPPVIVVAPVYVLLLERISAPAAISQ
jgi:hypothetical protein